MWLWFYLKIVFIDVIKCRESYVRLKLVLNQWLSFYLKKKMDLVIERKLLDYGNRV